jgi:hypothetical protein
MCSNSVVVAMLKLCSSVVKTVLMEKAEIYVVFFKPYKVDFK